MKTRAYASALPYPCQPMTSLFLGIAIGLLLAAPLAWWYSRRTELRVRELERAARSDERLAEQATMTRGLAHEIKNPLTSLRSAVETMHYARKDEQRQRLLAVIAKDVQRLDRLVTDISNASRRDSELVKEEEEPCDLLHMGNNLCE